MITPSPLVQVSGTFTVMHRRIVHDDNFTAGTSLSKNAHHNVLSLRDCSQ